VSAKPSTKTAAKTPAKAPRPAAPADDATAVDRYLAAYVMGIANRLTNGASSYYRKHFNLGMSEWRAMTAIGSQAESIVREVAEKADLDQAAASKSVRLLQERGLVTIEQTSRRGRAAIVRLTPEGAEVHRQLSRAALRRHKRLVAAFSAEELQMLWSLLRRLKAQVPHMNAE
jgi:DNA-binding MarR family transcriptional regulator